MKIPKLTEKEIIQASKALAKDILGEKEYRKNKYARESIMSDFKTGALWAAAMISIKIKTQK